MNIRQRLAGFQSFPYVNARVRAMREHLLTANDYRKMEKMSPAEILEFLQQKDRSITARDLESGVAS